MLYDTHVHLDELLARSDIEFELNRAKDVKTIIAVGGSPEANRQAAELARTYPHRILASAAYGRDRAGGNDCMNGLRTVLKQTGIVAVGETGLDLHHDASKIGAQITLFQQMLETAREYHLPVIVHSRNAEDLTISLLSEHVQSWKGLSSGPGVLHCFTGSRRFAKRLLDLGFYISFSGILTFRKADDLRATAATLPDDRLIIETDSPYLAPEPHRGKPNTPAFLRHVAEALAHTRRCSFEAIAEITTHNADLLFPRQ